MESQTTVDENAYPTAISAAFPELPNRLVCEIAMTGSFLASVAVMPSLLSRYR